MRATSSYCQAGLSLTVTDQEQQWLSVLGRAVGAIYMKSDIRSYFLQDRGFDCQDSANAIAGVVSRAHRNC